MHFELARLHARNIQQAGENRVLRGQRLVDAQADLAARIIVQMRGQQAGEHARGIQRLQQIMYGGIHKAGLVAVGLFGFLPGGVQVAGAICHALLQHIGQTAQLAGGVFVAGDVGIAGDKAAFGQRVATNFQHRSIALGAFMQMRFAAAQMLQAALNGRLVFMLAQQTAFGVVANQRFDGQAHAHQLGRVAKQLDVAGVPGHQVQIGINHHHALRQMLQAA